jgi:nucleoside-diphosphate-sugar epimerase
MPVMVVGADTPVGARVIDRLLDPEREVRAFVSDPDTAARLRERGAKVALGDVSDDSHLAGACLNCFSVVLVEDAARDDRERSFAPDAPAVLESWARAVASASVRRVIWLTACAPPPVETDEVAVVDPSVPDIAERVYEIDAAREI